MGFTDPRPSLDTLPMKDCKTIALANQKGGVGKTCSTVNLGIGLARHGEKVLLIDADAQGSLSASLGIRTTDELSVTIVDLMKSVIDGKAPPDNYGIIHQAEGVDLLPANIELSGFEVSMVNVMSREFVLREALEPLKEQYDHILIDCMPSLGMMTVNALAAADSVIIPTQPSYLSTKGIGQLIGTITKVRRQINPRLRIDGVLMTMVDRRTNNARDIIASLRQLGDHLRVFETEIPFSVRAAEASMEGKSIYQYDGSGKVAAAYDALTKEVLEHEQRENRRSRASERLR